jgi:hypothetical protein
MYPKQPFDVAGGRTGTVVFDVSADSQGAHAAWPEFWWTDQPVPAPHGEMPAQAPYARNSFGFTVASQCSNGGISIDQMMVTRSYGFAQLPFTSTGCITKGSATGALNHFEVRISQSRVEVWASDAGSTAVRMIAFADNANLTMTRGLVWLEQVSYNACKYDSQCDHTLAWDNLGWDGPAPYRDLSFDVPDNNVPHGGATRLGWQVTATPLALQTVPVFRLQTPTSAIVTFNWFPQGLPLVDLTVPSFRLNGGPWHDTLRPFLDTNTDAWRTLAVSVPVSEVKDGVNTIEFTDVLRPTVIANVNVILIAASPVS